MSTQLPTAEVVLIISLDDQRFPNEMYKPLFTSLFKLSRLDHISEPAYIIEYLNDNNPAAILVADPGIREPKNAAVLDKVKEYISGGGTIIFACMFSSFIRPPYFNNLFGTQFGLPWEFGGYYRTTVHLNADAVRNLKYPQPLHHSYSQKAVFLKNVKATDALYLPSSESVIESNLPGQVTLSQPAVAWAKVGNGRIGYVGDVNGEEGSNRVILTMCGF